MNPTPRYTILVTIVEGKKMIQLWKCGIWIFVYLGVCSIGGFVGFEQMKHVLMPQCVCMDVCLCADVATKHGLDSMDSHAHTHTHTHTPHGNSLSLLVHLPFISAFTTAFNNPTPTRIHLV